MVERQHACLPTGWRYYVVGDIHGEAGKLAELLAAIRRDLAAAGDVSAQLVCVGDYTDRGDDSYQVVETLLGDPLPGASTKYLCGNHDAHFADILAGGGDMMLWVHWGGLATMASYGVDLASARSSDDPEAVIRRELAACVPDSHRAFFDGLAVCHAAGDYFFCHAGVRPDVPLAAQSHDDLIWIREPFLSSTADFGAVVVHGHTPGDAVTWRPNRINIDTGACFGGPLTCLVLEGTAQRLIQV